MNSINEIEKKQKPITQIIRHSIQIASFILIPGLFILIWNSIGSIYQSIISGTFSFNGMASQIFILLAVIPITVLWGRFFCGYICAFGGMQELINFIARKLKIKQITIPKEIDKYMKYIKYIIIIIMIILWSAKIALNTNSPWNIFGIYSSYKGWSDLSSLISLGGFILLLIIISSLFVERIFCRYFCPLGGIFTLISKPRLYKIKKNSYRCIDCNMCSRKCAMNIDVNGETTEYGKVKSGECIDCFKCIDACNPCALYTNPKEAISGTVASIAIAGLYYGGMIATGNSYSEENLNTASTSKGKYIDGTYEGSGQGYRGTTSVKVKVSNGNITSITIESYKDDDQFFNKAKSTIINEIISAQSTDVNTVSGATFSSKGIIEAVANALNSSQSIISNTNTNQMAEINSNTENSSISNTTTNKSASTNSSSSNTSTNSSSSSTSNSTTSANTTNFSNLADGTYSGTGTGRNGSIKVSVIVKSGKVTSITIQSYVDDEQYFSRAKSTIISEIISSQSVNVSTVSGATMSSNGIIEAVANALGISYTNPNSTMQSSTKGSHGMR